MSPPLGPRVATWSLGLWALRARGVCICMGPWARSARAARGLQAGVGSLVGGPVRRLQSLWGLCGRDRSRNSGPGPSESQDGKSTASCSMAISIQRWLPRERPGQRMGMELSPKSCWIHMVTFQGTQPQTLLAPAICAAPAPARSRPVAPLFGFGPPPPPAARRPRGAQRVRARPRGAPCRPARRRRGGAWLRRAGPRGRTSSRRLLGRGAPTAGHTAQAAARRALSGSVSGREGPRSRASSSRAADSEAGGSARGARI